MTLTKPPDSALYFTVSIVSASALAYGINPSSEIISTFQSPATESSDVIENLSKTLSAPEYLTR